MRGRGRQKQVGFVFFSFQVVVGEGGLVTALFLYIKFNK
jgi:hypothetical protein